MFAAIDWLGNYGPLRVYLVGNDLAIAEELVELIAALVTSEPMLMVGVAVIASEKVAVTTTLSPLLTVVPETLSVKTTVGEMVSMTS